MNKVNEQDAINRIILYSIYMWEIGLSLLQLRRLKVMINSISIINLPSRDVLNDLELELIGRREEINNANKNLLLPLLKGKNFGHANLNRYRIGQTELKEGYCLFQEISGYTRLGIPIYTGRKYILLLVSHHDEVFGKFLAGELVEFEKCKHFLDELKLKTHAYKNITKTIFNSMHDSIGTYLRLK